MQERKEVILKTPLSVEEIKFLRAGDKVHLNGFIYVARDLTHQLLMEDLEKGKELPFSLSGSVIYYAGPTPTRRGEIIGSVGPTTSSRMDKYYWKRREKRRSKKAFRKLRSSVFIGLRGSRSLSFYFCSRKRSISL
jgi:tartrate dehydratase beta subunit/fumarate hydratase class I family protein